MDWPSFEIMGLQHWMLLTTQRGIFSQQKEGRVRVRPGQERYFLLESLDVSRHL